MQETPTTSGLSEAEEFPVEGVLKGSLLDISNELDRRRREDPLKHKYIPHEFQEKIHRSRSPITVVVGGNRTGKSTGAVAEALYYFLGRSTWNQVPDSPSVTWYVMPSLTQFRRTVLPIFRQLCPERVWMHFQKRDHMVRDPDTGNELWFVSSDMTQRRLQGASVDFVIIDEAQPRDTYEELSARTIDRHGRILMVLTPVDTDISKWMWIRDELYIPWQLGERPDVEVIHMPVADSEGNSLVPHFDRDDIKRMEQMWPDPVTQAVRMYGQFMSRAGLVFSLDEEVNVIPRFDIPDNWFRWLVCDPQYHRFAVLMFAADEFGNYYVTDEYFSTDELLAVRAKHIKAMVGEQDRPLPMYVDYANPQEIQELNYHFSREGVPVGATPLPIRKEVHKMVLRTHSMLEPSDAREYHALSTRKGIHGAPRLMIFDDIMSHWSLDDRPMNNSRLIWELKRLTWGKNGKPDKNSAGGSDCCDCLIYGCSILASGYEAEQDEAWRKALPDRDVRMWDMLLQEERQREMNK